MFIDTVSGQITGLIPNDHTRFQCSVSLTVPLDEIHRVGPGLLVAAENLLHKARDKRFTVLQVVSAFPQDTSGSKSTKGISFECQVTPIGVELFSKGKTISDIAASDTFPAFGASVYALDDETTASVLHQIAPESRSQENGSRVDIGSYASNPDVPVGLDYTTLIRGNAAVISSRPRARTTITNNLISALLNGTEHPLHVVYCDVNNQGTLSLINLIHRFDNTLVLGLNDKFVPQSVFHSLKQPGDRQTHKRAVLDYLDMMILPSVMEQRRHDFVYPISQLLRGDKFAIYRAHEQTVDEFINEIRIDILEGVDPEVEEYITDVLDGMSATYQGERFNDKNTKDILDMIDEFSQEAKIHAARRTLYDVRGEVQSAYESFSKDIPGTSRKTLSDVIYRLNDETKSSFTVIQGQKTTDILRFVGSLVQGLVDERLKRLKIRVPVLFIFNNADEYVPRTNGGSRESGGDRFQDILQTMLINGRRHGLGFCMTLEQASALEGALARRIQSYFIGTLRFREEPEKAGELINVSQELLHPAVSFEDGNFLFASADSPYHRRVPLPVTASRTIDVLYEFLDGLGEEQERRRKEMQAQEEERRKKEEERRKKEEEERRKQEEERKKRDEERKKKEEEERAKKRDEEKDDDGKGRRGKRGGRGRGRKQDDHEESAQEELLTDTVLEDIDEEPEVVIAEEDEAEEQDVVIAEVEIDDDGDMEADEDETDAEPQDEPTDDAPEAEEPPAEPAEKDKRKRPTRRGGRRHKKPGDRQEPKAEAAPAEKAETRSEAPEKRSGDDKPAPKDGDDKPADKDDAPKKPTRRGKRGGRRSPKKS